MRFGAALEGTAKNAHGLGDARSNTRFRAQQAERENRQGVTMPLFRPPEQRATYCLVRRKGRMRRIIRDVHVIAHDLSAWRWAESPPRHRARNPVPLALCVAFG